MPIYTEDKQGVARHDLLFLYCVK